MGLLLCNLLRVFLPLWVAGVFLSPWVAGASPSTGYIYLSLRTTGVSTGYGRLSLRVTGAFLSLRAAGVSPLTDYGSSSLHGLRAALPWRVTGVCHGLESLLPHVQWHLTSAETMLPFLH
jgi:hypothetical protein